jgi:hypothetical protein
VGTKLKTLITIIAIVAIAFVLIFFFCFNPSETAFFPKCPIYSFTGFYCSGCGSQRAIHQFLHGNILEGLKYNVLVLLLAVVILYDWLVKLIDVLFNKKITNLLHNPKTTYLILLIVVLFGILRNITIFPFTVLSP